MCHKGVLAILHARSAQIIRPFRREAALALRMFQSALCTTSRVSRRGS